MMHFRHITATVLLATCYGFLLTGIGVAQPQAPNLLEGDVKPYQLPNALLMRNGKKVQTAKEWTATQIPYIYQLFEKDVYGKFPGPPLSVTYIINSVDSNALAGQAICKQVTVYFTRYDISANMELLLYLPKQMTSPVPVFLGLNFSGNQTVAGDTGIIITKNWVGNGAGVVNNAATDSTRGAAAAQWNIPAILNRGYGVATVYCGDLEPDHPDGWKTGIRKKLAATLGIMPAQWGAIGVWAWGLSRALDYLRTDKAVDGNRVIVFGHSRLGKAALWAGASDKRFAAVISNESGEGGAALAKRNFGETVGIINQKFPHWFAPAYKKFSDHTNLLPVDQHLLLCLVAPRPLYVSSAAEDLWSDPKGEFLSVRQTTPVYALFKIKGLTIDSLPPVDEPAGDWVRYHLRSGKHDITNYDWNQYLDFADKLSKTKK